MPLGLRVFLGRLLGFVVFRVFRFRRQLILKQIRQSMPDLDDTAVQQTFHGIARHFGLLVFELLALRGMSPDEVKKICEFGGLEHVQSALAKGKGAFALAGHIGSWEMHLAAVSAIGLNGAVIVKDIKDPAINTAANSIRRAHGIEPIPRRNALRQILKTLREGRVVVFVLDFVILIQLK